MLHFLKKNVNLIVTVIIVLSFVAYSIIGFVCFYNVNQNYANKFTDLQQKIDNLEEKNSYLQQKIDLLNKKDSYSQSPIKPSMFYMDVGGGLYRYLAIGNSITLHAKSDYWFSECGMAASSDSRDYFHLIATEIGKKKSVFATAVNFSTWEMNSHDRSQTISQIDLFLDIELDLITIQLGENITDWSMLDTDFSTLIDYIVKKCPNTEIVIIGNFWRNNEVESIKVACAVAKNRKYISLSDLWDKKEYQCGIGTVVFGDDGISHPVTHGGVAIHPGDFGHFVYYERILKVIKF